jgi:hypothetical protein
VIIARNKQMGDKKDADIAVLWQSARLRITDQFTIPPEILNVGDSVIGTLGNFSASIGKAKVKRPLMYLQLLQQRW